MGRALHVAIYCVAAVMLGLVVGTVAVGVLAGPAGPTDALLDETVVNQSQPVAPPDLESSERLLLSGNLTTDTGMPSVDPGRSSSLAFDRLDEEYRANLLDARMAETDSSEEQVDVIRGDLATLEGELHAVHEAERRAFQSFARGGIGSDELLARLAVLHERSNIIQFRLNHLLGVTKGIASPVDEDEVLIIQGEISQLELEATTLDGPIRAEALRALRGNPTFDRDIRVQASRDGYTLTAIDDVVYLREIYVAPNRDRDASEAFDDRQDGRDRTQQLYPWTFENSIAFQDRVRAGTYRASVDHTHGTTTTFVDRATELPFREVLELDLLRLPTVEAFETTEAEVDVVLDRTYAGGPARLTVTEAGQTDPIRGATIRVDGRTVGETDGSGTVWFVTPGTAFELSITVDAGEIVRLIELPAGEPIAT